MTGVTFLSMYNVNISPITFVICIFYNYSLKFQKLSLGLFLLIKLFGRLIFDVGKRENIMGSYFAFPKWMTCLKRFHV